MADPIRILFVCTGNICRSPSAEGVFRHMARAAGLDGQVETDSCGLAGWHVGSPPTGTAQQIAQARGYDLSDLRARAFDDRDFDRFDLILAMDDGHHAQLMRRAGEAHAPKVAMFLEAADAGRGDVPDPYYGGREDYEYALDLIEAGCRGWLARLSESR